MEEQKRQAVIELIEIVNCLDMQSLALLTSGANMLKAKEQLDKSALRVG